MLVLFAGTVCSSACEGPESALVPAGHDAARIYDLYFVMAIGALLVWALVIGLTLYATAERARPMTPRGTTLLIVGGGTVFPVVVLGALLGFGLYTLPQVLALPASGPVVTVTGEQWWWRIHYQLPDGRAFETANELRLATGRRVAVQVRSADVIHAFWIPAFAGKIDAMPGRVNRIALEPTRDGTFRGVCAEYCGTSHAHMKLYAVSASDDEIAAWTEAQLAPAMAPATDEARRGEAVFRATGCGACHTVRGTDADGRVGPDLTHVGSRLSIAAGTLPVTVGDLQRWIQATGHVKPDARMPAFTMVPPADVRAMSVYLAGLR